MDEYVCVLSNFRICVFRKYSHRMIIYYVSFLNKSLTFSTLPLEIHMAPVPVIDLFVTGLELRFTGPHIDQQVQIPIQEFHGKVIGLQLPPGPLLLWPLGAAVAEQEEPAGLGRAEVEGDGAGFLGVPLGQRDVGLGCVEGDGVQGCHILAAEHQVTVDGYLGVTLDGQPGQLQLKVVVLVHNLENTMCYC